MLYKILRILLALVAGAGGAFLTYVVSEMAGVDWLREFLGTTWRLLLCYAFFSILFALIGFFIAPFLLRFFFGTARRLESVLTNMPFSDLIGACLGIIIGLLIAALVQSSFSSVTFIGPLLSVLLSVFLGYVGMVVGMKRKNDLRNLIAMPRIKLERQEKQEKNRSKKEAMSPFENDYYKVLDTSVIIDGRIADIVKTGFLDGVLLIPSFVLDELRHIADSSDILKRNRGRRGLDILNQISREEQIKVEIHEKDFDDLDEVDSKLVRLAQTLNCPVLTNDFNLNKVAELQGVKVLNINELANALKPVALPGEEMYVQVLKEGKEAGQGVAYLDDGTMIVVDGGRKHIGHGIAVMVTTVLQTAAGRMIFARIKD
jgi:uncharacterized protein YacL